jgi:hypothetical protein
MMHLENVNVILLLLKKYVEMVHCIWVQNGDMLKDKWYYNFI